MQTTRVPAALVDPAGTEPGVAPVIAAFGAVYVIWGSTYLGILWAIETMPPLLMASVRFLVAGGLLYAWSVARGTPATRARARMAVPGQWRAAALAGGLMLGAGNGAVTVAEQWVPSGLAALLVASVPLWLVVLDALFGSRTRPSMRARVGLFAGFGGVALLGGAPGVGQGGPLEALGALLILGGCAAWAAGSLYLRYVPPPPHPLMWVAKQMISGGALLGIVSLVTGEWMGFRVADVSLRSWLSLAYLIVFGALIAYSAYVWLLRVSTPARIGTYAYVNPVIALFLGWRLADEPLGFRSMLAAAIIVGSVVVIVSEARVANSRGVPVSQLDKEADRPPA
ncbi:MAG TPA: EamA family transporter [Longimicrobiales bacterium]|jgi:drug/metabolite transporter (DMT)-like permease|nr:EamA family transporter [Longimicrobiales bacterium]